MTLGATEIVVFLIIVSVLIFGASKIPKIFRSMGRATGEFRKGKLEMEQEISAEFGSAAARADPARAKLENAAKAYEIDPTGMSDEELRAEIQAQMD